MAFPQVAGTASSSHDTTQTSHTVSLPGSIAAGDLLIAIFAYNGGFQLPSFPAGWTRSIHSNANNVGAVWAYRYADGGEGASITVTTGVATRSAHFAYRITGHGHLAPKSNDTFWQSGTTSTPGAPTISGPDGAKDYLWIDAVAADSGFVCTAAPASYTDLQTSDGGSQADLSVAVSVARRELNAASENPGDFTLEGAEGWLANVICVHPFVEQIVDRRIVHGVGRRAGS